MNSVMNSRTANLLLEAEGPVPSTKKKKKRKFNPRVCSELDNIGRHIATDTTVEYSECKFCGLPMSNGIVIQEES